MTNELALKALMSTRHPWLTDGGFETSLIFHEGLDLPSFSAAAVLDDDKARAAITRYFEPYLTMAADARTGFVLDTATWRAGLPWGPELGRSAADMLRLNRDAVAFAKDIQDRWRVRIPHILLNGVVGPAGDGYAPDRMLTAAEAQGIHAPQVEALVGAGAETITAVTMTHTGEGIGVAKAAMARGVPFVISYTTETDGRLPSGESLADAIGETDEATSGAALYYMINCAHPDHFRSALARGDGWLGRIGGIRANASRRRMKNWTTPKTWTTATRMSSAASMRSSPQYCRACASLVGAAVRIHATSGVPITQ